MSRTVGLWLYQEEGGSLIEQRFEAGLRERSIDCRTRLNLRDAVVRDGGIVCGDICLDELDLFLPYNLLQLSSYPLYLYDLLDRSIPVINNFKAFSTASDRVRSRVALNLAEISYPEYFLCHRDDSEKIYAVINSWGGQALYKSLSNMGIEETMIRSSSDLERLIARLDQFDIRQLYIEKPIDYDGTEYRVEVVAGEALACYVYRNDDGDWCANARTLGSESVYGLNPELAELAVKAAAAVQLDIAAIDIVFDRDKEDYIVANIDAVPSFASPEQEALGLDFNEKKIAKIINLIDQKTRELNG